MCDTAQRYSLADVHSFICKNASKIEHWLPEAVRQSLQELEKVVSDNVATTQLNVYGNRHGGGNWRGGGGARMHRGHHDGGKRGSPQWKNDNWDNFRTFKATKVLSSETPTTKFRVLFNKMTDGSLPDTVKHMAELLAKVTTDEVVHEMAQVVLDGVRASPGNADLYARFLRALQEASNERAMELARVTIDRLRTDCVANTTKAAKQENDSYDAMCVANAANDSRTTHLKLAVLCEKHGVLAPGSTTLLLKRLAKKLTKLGTKAEDKASVEVLTARLVSVLEVTGAAPVPEVRAAIDLVLEHCGQKSEFPGLKNKVQFTLMDYLDTLGA